MDKVKIVLSLLIFICFFSCNNNDRLTISYDIEFIRDNGQIVLSSINGFVPSSNGVLVYGNVNRFTHHGLVIPKGSLYSLLKITNKGAIDANFINPFKKPNSIFKIIEYQKDQYFVFHKETDHPSKLCLSILNKNGMFIECFFNFTELISDSINHDLIKIGDAAIDSTGNIYFSIESSSLGSKNMLIKLTPSLQIDKVFQKNISGIIDIHEINSIIVQPDNNIIFGGRFKNKSEDYSFNHICRINTKGLIDSSFCRNLPKFEKNDYNRVYTISIIDSALYIGGNFKINVGNKNISDLIRLNMSGSLNTHQINKNHLFQYIDDEPYFNKSTIFYIKEIDDENIIVSGIFNRDSKNNEYHIPIAIINKNVSIEPVRFSIKHNIFQIPSFYFINPDTIFIFGTMPIFENSKLPIALIVKK